MDFFCAKEFGEKDLADLINMMQILKNNIDQTEIKIREHGETFPGVYMFEFLEKANVNIRIPNISFKYY